MAPSSFQMTWWKGRWYQSWHAWTVVRCLCRIFQWIFWMQVEQVSCSCISSVHKSASTCRVRQTLFCLCTSCIYRSHRAGRPRTLRIASCVCIPQQHIRNISIGLWVLQLEEECGISCGKLCCSNRNRLSLLYIRRKINERGYEWLWGDNIIELWTLTTSIHTDVAIIIMDSLKQLFILWLGIRLFHQSILPGRLILLFASGASPTSGPLLQRRI